MLQSKVNLETAYDKAKMNHNAKIHIHTVNAV